MDEKKCKRFDIHICIWHIIINILEHIFNCILWADVLSAHIYFAKTVKRLIRVVAGFINAVSFMIDRSAALPLCARNEPFIIATGPWLYKRYKMMIASLPRFQRRDNYLFVRSASSINICRTNENDNYFIGNIKLWRSPLLRSVRAVRKGFFRSAYHKMRRISYTRRDLLVYIFSIFSRWRVASENTRLVISAIAMLRRKRDPRFWAREFY